MKDANPGSVAEPRRLSIRTIAAGALMMLAAACGDGGAETSGAAGKPDKPAAAKPSKGDAIVDGEMFATVNGEKRKWYVTHIERGGDWRSGSFWRPAPMKSATIHLTGLTEKGDRLTGKGDLRLGLIAVNLGGATRGTEPRLSMLADGVVKTWTSEENGEATVLLNRAIVDGEYLELGGGFSGVVMLPDEDAADTDQPKAIKIENGSFAVRIRQYQKSR